jgi:hypothetical protein
MNEERGAGARTFPTSSPLHAPGAADGHRGEIIHGRAEVQALPAYVCYVLKLARARQTQRDVDHGHQGAGLVSETHRDGADEEDARSRTVAARAQETCGLFRWPARAVRAVTCPARAPLQGVDEERSPARILVMALSNTSSFPDQNGRDPLSFADQQDGHIPATAPALPGRPAPGPSRAAADAGTCTLTSAATVKPAHGPPRTLSVARPWSRPPSVAVRKKADGPHRPS